MYHFLIVFYFLLSYHMISYDIVLGGEDDVEIIADFTRGNDMIAVFQSKDMLTIDQLIAQTKKTIAKKKVLYIPHKDFKFMFDTKPFTFHFDNKYFYDFQNKFWYAILFKSDDSIHFYEIVKNYGYLILIRI